MRHWFAAERNWTPDQIDGLEWHWAQQHIEWAGKRAKGYNTGNQ